MRYLREGGLYMLFAALLVGTLWRGGYFPGPKWGLTFLLLTATGWELVVTFAEGRRAGSLRSPALWLFLTFAVFASLSAFWTVTAGDTQRDASLLLALAGIIFVVRGNLARSGRRALSMCAMWLVYVAAFVSTWGIITYLLRLAPYTVILDNVYRAGSSLEYSNALACFGLMALPVSAALYRTTGKAERPGLGIAFSLQTAAVVLSFSRAGIAALLITGLYAIFAARRERLSLELFFAFAGGLLIAAVAIVATETGYPLIGLMLILVLVAGMILGHMAALSPVFRKYRSVAATLVLAGTLAAGAAAVLAVFKVDRLRTIIAIRFEEGLTYHRLLPHRLGTWSGSIEALRARPLTGSGLGSYYYVYQRYAMAAYTKYAHNVILQMAVETGLIGAALFALFLGYAVVMSAVRLFADLFTGRNPLAGAFAVSVIAFTGYNMFDWEWYVPAVTAWFMLGVACVEWRDTADVERERRGT